MHLGLTLLLSAWVLLLSLATVSPELHNWFHLHEENNCAGHCHSDHSNADAEDPSDPDHVCAVTLFAGGVDCDVPVSLPSATFLPSGDIDDPVVETPIVVHRSLLRARAPPVAV